MKKVAERPGGGVISQERGLFVLETEIPRYESAAAWKVARGLKNVSE